MNRYTTIEQSKKLLELGLDPHTSDCYWEHAPGYVNWDGEMTGYFDEPEWGESGDSKDLPCWSLAALLDNIPQVKVDTIKQYDKKLWRCCACFASDWHDSDWCDNPIDACYEMILKLHELKML